MTSRGRKRLLEIERSATGRITRKARQEAVVEPAIASRMRLFRVTRTRASDPATGHVLGRLAAHGMISDIQVATGLAFQGIVRGWTEAAEAPRPVPRAAAAAVGGGSGARATDDTPEDEARHRRAQAVLEALNREGVRPKVMVWSVCIEESDARLTGEQIGDLRQGLNAVLRALQRNLT